MGTYRPKNDARNPSLTDTLREAEQDHYLDCPNADFLSRVAAVTLDLMFLFLVGTGLNHLCLLLVSSLSGGKPTILGDPLVLYKGLSLLIFTLLVFFYLLWPIHRFGGTPGKQLLGLRVLDSRSGEKLSIQRTVLREIAGKALSLACFGVGFLLPLIRKDGKALHDLLSRSAVKKIFGNS